MEKKEAMKILKDFHDKSALFSVRTALDTVFPELKESEDERIRNEIIAILQYKYEKYPNDPKYCNSPQWIAWLEKQGESDETKAKMFLINKGYPIDANGTFPTYEEMYNIIKEGFENQREQTLTEWSEEDERTYRGLHNLIYSTPYCDSRKELSDFLDSLKNRLQSNLQQEWGKEDEKCIRLSTDIIDSALRAGFCVQLDRDRCVDWLKSLKDRVQPQKQWKPSEEYILVVESCMKEFDEGSIKWNLLKELLEQLKQL